MRCVLEPVNGRLVDRPAQNGGRSAPAPASPRCSANVGTGRDIKTSGGNLFRWILRCTRRLGTRLRVRSRHGRGRNHHGIGRCRAHDDAAAAAGRPAGRGTRNRADLSPCSCRRSGNPQCCGSPIGQRQRGVGQGLDEFALRERDHKLFRRGAYKARCRPDKAGAGRNYRRWQSAVSSGACCCPPALVPGGGETSCARWWHGQTGPGGAPCR